MYTTTAIQNTLITCLLQHDLIEHFESVIVDQYENIVVSFTDTEGEHYQWAISKEGKTDIKFGQEAIGDWRQAVMGLTYQQLNVFNAIRGCSFIELSGLKINTSSIILTKVSTIEGKADWDVSRDGWISKFNVDPNVVL